MRHTVVSYGIALMRKVNCPNGQNKYEFLFIKKRSTYAFITFVKGIYSKNSDQEVMKLLDNMTVEEKLCILSLNFANIWYCSYLKTPRHMSNREILKFENCKMKFEKKFLGDSGARLKKLIADSRSVGHIWEMPKGMKNKNESEYNAAFREFTEETGISKTKYRILWNEPKFEYKFVDENVEYKYVYVPAIMMDPKYKPSVHIGDHSSLETSDIKFMSAEDTYLVTGNKKLFNFLNSIKKKIKKHA